MANNTKTQLKKRIEELKEKISDIRVELEDLQSDIESESGDIEPYEGRSELTRLVTGVQTCALPISGTVEEAASSLQEAEDGLENIE